MNDDGYKPLDIEGLMREAQAANEKQDELPEDFRSGYVAVVGQPNVGKSTLMNRLVGQKIAIVSPKPQTTRRRILGILTNDRGQVMFVDTPGIHDPQSKLGAYMNVHALGAIPDADVVVFMVQGGTVPDEQDEKIAVAVRKFQGPKILVINKIDVIPQEVANARYAAYEKMGQWDRVLLISALEGHGVEGVLDAILELLPKGPLYFPAGQVTDQTERTLGAEIIREIALGQLEHEVPHALNVEIIEWSRRKSGVIYIEANLTVERDSQKGIVIGAKGQMLKKIGAEARRQIESELGIRAYLELYVKVRDRWRDDDAWLRRYGYKPE